MEKENRKMTDNTANAVGGKTRDQFDSRWGFILACIGSAVGMGNLWRFPTMISVYGGLTFLLPYLLFVLLIGSTGIIEEFALGRAAGTGPVGAFGMCTEMRFGSRKAGEAIGVLPILGALGLAIGYTCVFGWIIKYTYMAVSGDLMAMGTEMAVIEDTFYNGTASAGSNNLFLIIGVLIAFGIMSFGISKGIEIANKILMPLLFGLLVVLAIYIATLPGAGDGYKYIFTFNGKGLADPKVWIFAFGQAFFSLSVAGNGSVIYGSYLSKDENLPTAARNVAIFDTVASLLAALVIIPAMATAGSALESGGPGLLFIYIVNVINAMPGGRIIGIVFYVAVLFAAMSSIINMYEAPVELLQQKLKLHRVAAVGIVLVICGAIALAIQAIVSDWMDVISIYICPFGALLAGIMFFWLGSRKFVNAQASLGSPKPIGKWFYPLGKYVYCAAALVALIAGAVLGGIG